MPHLKKLKLGKVLNANHEGKDYFIKYVKKLTTKGD